MAITLYATVYAGGFEAEVAKIGLKEIIRMIKLNNICT